MANSYSDEVIERKRQLEQSQLLASLQGILELPLALLSFVFLIVFIIEIAAPLSADQRRILGLVQWGIWTAFVVEYLVGLSLAPNKAQYVRANLLSGLSILLPIFRMLRIAQAARAARSLRALRAITLGNRTVRKLGILFSRRRLQYLAAVTLAVIIVGGAGMLHIERSAPNSSIRTFGDALWWAAGATTTIGTELHPTTTEGRILAFLVMVFGVALFGYVAGSLASLFVSIDKDAEEEEHAATLPGDYGTDQLLDQIRGLEASIAALRRMTAAPDVNSESRPAG